MNAEWNIGRLFIPAALAVLVAACANGDTGDDNGEAASISIHGCEPLNPLIPSNTAEVCGGNPMDQMFTGLVAYNPRTAEPENAVASAISSDDNVTWRIALHEGWKFHDGTDVTADSFVSAWNWAAYGPHGQANSYFFAPIKGYTDVEGEDANGDDEITADEAPTTEMSGLRVISDTEFTVELDAPSSVFPVMLGYIAFAPLPASFFDDPEAFGRAPVGNGPFTFVSSEPDVSIKLTAFDDYPGPELEVKDVEYKMYRDANAAYADLISNNLDIMWKLPTSALTDDLYLDDLGDRVVDQADGSIVFITAPQYVAAYDNPDLTRAISMAIDRESVIDVAFNGARTPATGWVSPVVNGYQGGICGPYCSYDPEAAKALFDTTGFEGPITLTYNADGDHKTWAEATCNSISNVLVIECLAVPMADTATFLTTVQDQEATGLLKGVWLMDYPSIENFLVPLYATGASSNDGGYSSPDFDAAVAEAATLQGEEAIEKYQEAEAILAEDFPVIPLWYGRTVAGYSENITEVRFTPFSTVDLTSVRLS